MNTVNDVRISVCAHQTTTHELLVQMVKWMRTHYRERPIGLKEALDLVRPIYHGQPLEMSSEHLSGDVKHSLLTKGYYNNDVVKVEYINAPSLGEDDIWKIIQLGANGDTESAVLACKIIRERPGILGPIAA